jgi:Prenyltransferase and squalene oxidase repeat
VGVKLAAAAAATALAATPVGFLQGRQALGGGFVEPSGASGPQLTAWAALGLKAAGASTGRALDYLVAHEGELTEATDVELVALAQSALGHRPDRLLTRIRRFQRPNGAIGPTVNSTIWGIIALRQAGEPVPRAAVRLVLRRQARSGGWSWYAGGFPDSNDTAAAVQALRSAGVGGVPVRRALAFLRRLQNRDGGFELTPGHESDTQSTAWVIQAFVAARKPVPRGSLAFLRSMRRSDGSFRYSRRYATTPVWVTAQVLPALARRAFPL